MSKRIISISLDVDIDELAVLYRFEKVTEPVEFWGSKTYESGYEIDIEAVYYGDKEIFDYDEDAIIDWIITRSGDKDDE